MNNYIIYKIYCDDIDDYYIGSTNSFSSRKASHKLRSTTNQGKHSKSILYKTINDNGGWNNWTMKWCGDTGTTDKKEAHRIEYYILNKLKPSLNTIFYKTDEERKEHIKKNRREYHIKNREIILKKHKEYHHANKEACNKISHEYYEKNKVEILKKQNEKGKKLVNCPECDKLVTRYNLSKHIKYVHNKCEEPKANCPMCNKEIRKRSLSRHIKEFHNKIKQPKANCPMCNKEMIKPSINRHIRNVHK